ncbi:MAG: S46 family peptidase, partial [Bacteroidales bacterium]|nr:S46 family peptidase [Bacteroidales bacterium]
MWPRHSGDFSVFRVYADKNNNPTEFSNANIPYKPKSHFKISLKGLNDGDFTMVFGYPGITESYLPSCAVKYRQEVDLPARVCVRQLKMDLMEEAMNADRQIKIDYASRYSGVENGKKKWEGAIAGLRSCDAVGRKQEQEREFQQRLSNAELRGKYSNIIKAFCSIYNATNIHAARCVTYFTESLYGLSQFKAGEQLTRLKNSMSDISTNIDNEINNVESKLRATFEQRDSTLERKLFVALYQIYCDSCPDYMPNDIDSLYAAHGIKEHKDFVDVYYNTSSAAQLEKALQVVAECREALKLTGKKRESQIASIVDALSHDIGVYFYQNYIRMLFQKAYFTYYDMIKAEEDMYGRYQSALLEVMPELIPFPDANSTLRFTYGKVGGFEPRDAVIYKSFTTLDGVIAKDRPSPADYHAPEALVELHRTRNYGRYADKDGKIHVCFVASNRTTGGNSGSPVINGEGHLVGINFDRCWEGTMSDIMYDPSICRNISVDIRYVLFLIDKLGNAQNIIKELDIVK